MIAALIGVGGALFLAIVGATWHMGSRLAKIEGRLDYLVNGAACADHREEIRAAIRRETYRHEERHHDTATPSNPPHPPPPSSE